jgi:hypothetical protein
MTMLSAEKLRRAIKMLNEAPVPEPTREVMEDWIRQLHTAYADEEIIRMLKGEAE